MLSYRCWRTRFRSDPYIVGKPIVLDRREVFVVAALLLFWDSTSGMSNLRSSDTGFLRKPRIRPGKERRESKLSLACD